MSNLQGETFPKGIKFDRFRARLARCRLGGAQDSPIIHNRGLAGVLQDEAAHEEATADS